MKLFRQAFILILLVLAAFLLPWSRVNWGRVQLGSSPSITVYGYAQNQERNQIATFTAGVQAINDDKQTATNEVNGSLKKIIQAVKDFGIDEDDIKTQDMSVYQAREAIVDDEVHKQQMGQWHANNTIEIKLYNVDQASDLAAILVENGANNVHGPNFQLEDQSSSEDTLLEEAVANAREKAERIAQANNQKLGKIITMNEDASSKSNYPLLMERASLGEDSSYPAEPGMSTLSKTVTVTFELK